MISMAKQDCHCENYGKGKNPKCHIVVPQSLQNRMVTTDLKKQNAKVYSLLGLKGFYSQNRNNIRIKRKKEYR